MGFNNYLMNNPLPLPPPFVANDKGLFSAFPYNLQMQCVVLSGAPLGCSPSPPRNTLTGWRSSWGTGWRGGWGGWPWTWWPWWASCIPSSKSSRLFSGRLIVASLKLENSPKRGEQSLYLYTQSIPRMTNKIKFVVNPFLKLIDW